MTCPYCSNENEAIWLTLLIYLTALTLLNLIPLSI